MAHDFDFIGFTFNGKHSYEDFKIYRVSDGSRYNDNLIPQLNDKTTEVPGGNGQYYFYSTYKTRQFSISIAFDKMAETTYRKMRQWLNGKEICDLVFDESPYKVYSAKVTGTPQLKTVCFDVNGQREYRGEGLIQFTCYYPFAHTPNTTKSGGDGRSLNSYLEEDYPNKIQWQDTSGMKEEHTEGKNYGDLPSPFILKRTEAIEVGSKFNIGNMQITILEACSHLVWDSKTGLVVAIPSGEDDPRPINYSGKSYGTIPTTNNGEAEAQIYYFYKDTDEKYYRVYIDRNKHEYDDINSTLVAKRGKATKTPFTIEYNYWYY